MTGKIFRAIFSTVTILLTICLVITGGIMYSYFSEQHRQQIITDAAYIASGYEVGGKEYLGSVKNKDNRITIISSDGTVLYDSVKNPAEMDNHADREEVILAEKNGTGESTRYSETLAEQTFYYALKLPNGEIFRVSTTGASTLTMILGFIQPLLVVFAIAIVVAAVAAYYFATKIVKPINEMNIDFPEEDIVYDELAPFAEKINAQKKRIHEQVAELQFRQQEFTAITENMNEGFLVVDRKTNVLSYNSAAVRLLGASIDEVRKSAFAINRSEGFRIAVNSALDGHNCCRTMTAANRHYQIMANPVYEKEELVGAIIIIVDVTEKEERESLRREFTANVSHELKTPLTSISGFAEIIRNGLARDEDIKHFAGNIYSEAQRLIALVGDIINLSRLDESCLPEDDAPLDLYLAAKNVAEELSSAAVRNDVSTEVFGVKTIITGNARVIEEMIFNLVDNAIKYNVRGGNVKISVTQDKREAFLTVEDTGIGIPDAEQDRVFERFYRVDKSRSRAIGGTGLGLSIVKHGAQYHNARISMNSVVGKGTEIKITFPI